ncbi:MAG: hypothetical protein GY870_19340 [archaeon]|nr:hypothetical protein [archaeon]
MFEIYKMKDNGDSIILILSRINDIIFYVNYSPNHKIYNLDKMSKEDFLEFYDNETISEFYEDVFCDICLPDIH